MCFELRSRLPIMSSYIDKRDKNINVGQSNVLRGPDSEANLI